MQRQREAFRKRDGQTVKERVRATVTDREREEVSERGDRGPESVLF